MVRVTRAMPIRQAPLKLTSHYEIHSILYSHTLGVFDASEGGGQRQEVSKSTRFIIHLFLFKKPFCSFSLDETR